MTEKLVTLSKIETEIPVVFKCRENELLGMVHTASDEKPIGILIIVGGSQYRVGAHRQFILLARKLAEQGVSVMRFDQRSIGDANGSPRRFDQIEDDIQSAIDVFMLQCPYLSGVILWGLCDAASAALFYAHVDSRIKGLVLLNPWVYTEQGEAKAYFKHYYLEQIISSKFWVRFFRFKFNYQQSLRSMLHLFRQLFIGHGKKVHGNNKHGLFNHNMSLPEKMRNCLGMFQHPVLLILSGHDLTADQFRELVKSDQKWQALMAEDRVSQHELLEADHTFSSAVWRDQVAKWTLDWLLMIESSSAKP